MNITYHPISPEQKHVLAHLLEFYVYEFSAYIDTIELNENGLYGFDHLDTFFTDPAYHPYLIRVNQKIAGFVIVKTIEENGSTIHTIAEFFIVKKYSGRNIGKTIAKQIFARYPGKWRVHQIEKNYPAQAFWRSVIKEYTNNRYSERYNERRESVQEFTSNP